MGKCRRKLKDGEYFNSSNNRYEYHYTDRLGKKRVIQLSAARSKAIGRYHMMMGENPIYIITLQNPGK